MAVKMKAVVISPEKGGLGVILDFLFRMGFRETVISTDIRQPAYLAIQGFWPVVFIDHIKGNTDCISIFEKMFNKNGYEYFPYIFIVPDDEKETILNTLSIGGTGFIRKPLQPNEAKVVIQDVIVSSLNPQTQNILNTALQLMDGDFHNGIRSINEIKKQKNFKKLAEISEIRCNIQLGEWTKAEKHLKELIESNPDDIRLKSEIINYYLYTNNYSQAEYYLNEIQTKKSNLNFRIWDLIKLKIDLEDYDGICTILDKIILNEKDKQEAAELFSRLLYLFGQEDKIVDFIKPFSKAQKNLTPLLTLKTKK